MNAVIPFSEDLAAYNLGPEHPLRPERVLLALELIEAFGLIGDGGFRVIEPLAATEDDLLLVHDAAYLGAVKAAGASPDRHRLRTQHGIGPGDTPAFPQMHEAAALVAGATTTALREILTGNATRAFAIAGGLHHAHHDRAAGFCVYNDPAVAIAVALREHPELRVLYVDIDGHHGDGVQEAFYDEPRVLTISLHESGRYLFPGTGFADERGEGAGLGSAANIPLPMYATDACYRLAFEEAVLPLAREFGPDVIVAQCGADALHGDPLTTLGLTIPGYAWLVRALIALSEELSAGRILACGGGGYDFGNGVPRAWTLLAAALLGRELPEELPESWREHILAITGRDAPRLLSEDRFAVTSRDEEWMLADVRASIRTLRES